MSAVLLGVGLTATIAPAAQAAPARASACTADQLTGTLRDLPAGANTDVIRVHLHDHGGRCELRGRPTGVTGIRGNGRHVEISTHPFSHSEAAAYDRGRRPAILRRHHVGEVALAASQGCSAGQSHRSRTTFSALVLHLGHHRLVRVQVIAGPEPHDTTVTVPCGADESHYSVVTTHS
jgi:hypothetical protein